MLGHDASCPHQLISCGELAATIREVVEPQLILHSVNWDQAFFAAGCHSFQAYHPFLIDHITKRLGCIQLSEVSKL
jgi:hypothetical protein